MEEMSEEKLIWEERGKGHTQKVEKCQHKESLMTDGSGRGFTWGWGGQGVSVKAARSATVLIKP